MVCQAGPLCLLPLLGPLCMLRELCASRWGSHWLNWVSCSVGVVPCPGSCLAVAPSHGVGIVGSHVCFSKLGVLVTMGTQLGLS